MTHSSTPPGPPALDHLSIPVASLDRALGFYRDVLGMTLAWREPGMAMLRAGGTELALNDQAHPRPAEALHFGFRTRSIEEAEAWAAYLAGRGVAGLRVERAPGVVQVYFQDPDGYTLEIYFPGSEA